MIQWHKEALRVLPQKHANFLLFCTLTGLRGSEAVESIKLVARTHQKEPYYNQETGTLEHFRYPEIFLRRTKSVYISIVNDEIIGIAEKVGLNPSLPGLKKAFKVRSLSMRVKYCRKIYASWLSNYGLQKEVIDMLQGRVNSSVFSRHYLTSSDGLRDKVLEAVTELARKLE